MARVQDDSSIISKMSDVVAHPFKVGFSDSISQIFIAAASVMLVGFLVTLLMPKVELRSQSASAAMRQQAAEGGASSADEAGDNFAGLEPGTAPAGTPPAVNAAACDIDATDSTIEDDADTAAKHAASGDVEVEAPSHTTPKHLAD